MQSRGNKEGIREKDEWRELWGEVEDVKEERGKKW